MRAFVRRRPHRVGGFKLVFGVGRMHLQVRFADSYPALDEHHPRGVHAHFTADGWVLFVDWRPRHLKLDYHFQRRGWHDRRSSSSASTP